MNELVLVGGVGTRRSGRGAVRRGEQVGAVLVAVHRLDRQIVPSVVRAPRPSSRAVAVARAVVVGARAGAVGEVEHRDGLAPALEVARGEPLQLDALVQVAALRARVRA